MQQEGCGVIARGDEVKRCGDGEASAMSTDHEEASEDEVTQR